MLSMSLKTLKEDSFQMRDEIFRLRDSLENSDGNASVSFSSEVDRDKVVICRGRSKPLIWCPYVLGMMVVE